MLCTWVLQAHDTKYLWRNMISSIIYGTNIAQDKHNRNVDIRLWDVMGVFSSEQHDNVIKWKHFPRYWPFVRGIHRSSVNSQYKGQWRGALMFSLICAWMNRWVNNGEACDLGRYRAHYDVMVMMRSGTWYKRIEPYWWSLFQVIFKHKYFYQLQS